MITRELSVVLTEEEKSAKSQEAARASMKYDELESEKKAATRDLTEQMKRLRTQWQKLARQISSGKETRPVECEEVYEHRQGVAHLKRKDTGEVIETRPMKSDERQTPLFSIGGTGVTDKTRKAKSANEGPLTVTLEGKNKSALTKMAEEMAAAKPEEQAP